MRPFVLIPAYQPTEQLITLVNKLLHEGIENILVVDDGSDEKQRAIFSQLPANVLQLRHANNQGKGAALKTGYQYLQRISPFSPVITVDADGQHLPEDVKKLYKQAQQQPFDYIIGVRAFDEKTPWRSRFGNGLTRKLFQSLFGFSLQDTQTGLRSTPVWLQQNAMKIRTNQYEFETECLLMAYQNNINIVQTSINTVYIENNKSSHFHPVFDSIKIYSVLFKYWLSPIFYSATMPTHR